MDLKEYKEQYPRISKRLSRLEKKTRIAELMLELKKFKGFKLLLEELEIIIHNINEKLMTSKKLETEEREKLMVDKERCMWLSNMLGHQEQIIKNTKVYLSKLK